MYWWAPQAKLSKIKLWHGYVELILNKMSSIILIFVAKLTAHAELCYYFVVIIKNNYKYQNKYNKSLIE
jgi:hypothetical protein